MNIVSFIIVLFFLGLPFGCFGQLLVPTIQINLDKVPDDLKPLWQDAEKSLRYFLTTPKWHENPYDYEVPFQISIYIEQVIEKPPERTYKSYLVATNGAEAYFTDKRWIYPLPEWRNLHRDGRYHPMLSVIEFYANLILANEFDKWDLFGGESYYIQARTIADQGKFDARFISGWHERSDLVQSLTARNRRMYRTFLYYACTGDYLIQYNPREARPFADSAFLLLPSLPSEDRKMFLNANAISLAKLAVGLGKKDYLELLIKLDSTHSSLYEEQMKHILK
ncbi:MAG: DUF4835 family protein [bacterium]|nr:DUF4835 family protein [bacterium]